MLLGSLMHVMSAAEVAQLVLLYNVVAFGGQPIAGLITDGVRNPRAAASIGLLLTFAGLLLSPADPRAAIVVAGAGGALFHVGGGALALCAAPGRAAPVGMFAAPGVLGLAIGGALAASNSVPVAPFAAALAIVFALVAAAPVPPLPYRADRRDEPMFDRHDVVMMLLLSAIALRSAVWNIFQLIESADAGALVVLAIAAAIGKVCGGVIADYVGWRLWSMAALIASTPILTFAGHRLAPLAFGLALLQSATAPLLAMLAQSAPRHPATAAGLGLGLAIAAGGLPSLVLPAALQTRIVVALFGTGAVAVLAAVGRMRPSPASSDATLSERLRSHGHL
jgi:FSR family fosmidomycin resistance protein-like MFS transporter